MNPIACLLCAVLLSGCTSTFKDASKLEAFISHKADGNKLLVTAKVFNHSDRPVTFVQHPDFYSISVVAEDRSKDEAHNSMVVSFERATRDHLLVVRPGESATFPAQYHIRRRSGGIIDVVWGSSGADHKTPFMRIRDKKLQATFHYGKHPNYLPKHAWALGRNYVMTEITARKTFPAP